VIPFVTELERLEHLSSLASRSFKLLSRLPNWFIKLLVSSPVRSLSKLDTTTKILLAAGLITGSLLLFGSLFSGETNGTNQSCSTIDSSPRESK
jgi:hypothetical protein